MTLLLAVCSTVMADDFAYLTIAQTDSQTDFALSNISKITFDTQNMVLHLSDGQEAKLPLSGLSKMFFSNNSSGIATVSKTSTITIKDGMLRVTAPKGSVISVFDTSGKALRSTNARNTETEISLSGMQKGVYIVKVGSETKKVLNK